MTDLALPADVQQMLDYLDDRIKNGATSAEREAAILVLQLVKEEITRSPAHPPRTEPPHRDRRYFVA